MKETGSMIFNMVKGKKAGLTGVFTTVSTKRVRNTGGAHTSGTMGHDMRANGTRIRSRVSGSTPG